MKAKTLIPMAAAALTVVGCASGPELTSSQKTWQSDTAVLIEARDPELRTLAKTGIPEIDVVADSIAALSAFSSEAMVAYLYEQDAKSCWESYAQWATDAEAGKLRKENAKAFVGDNTNEGIAVKESKNRTFPLVLKRNSEDAEQDVMKLWEFDGLGLLDEQFIEDAGLSEGTVEELKAQAPRDRQAKVVQACYKPITVMVPKVDEATGKKVYRTVNGGEAVIDNEEALPTRVTRSVVNTALNRIGAGDSEAGKSTEAAPLTFTYLPGKVPTRTPAVPAKITANGKETANPEFETLQERAGRGATVVITADPKTKEPVSGYETFTQEDKFIKSYVCLDGVYSVEKNAIEPPAEGKTVADCNGYVNARDALAIDALTNRPAVVKEPKQIDLAVLLVKCYESTHKELAAIQDAKTDEAREEAEKAYEEAIKAAQQKYLNALAMEGIDWGALVETLTVKSAQAAADAALLTTAIKNNQGLVTGLAFGKSVCDDISAKDSLAALNRIRKQAAINAKLFPRLIGAITSSLTE